MPETVNGERQGLRDEGLWTGKRLTAGNHLKTPKRLRKPLRNFLKLSDSFRNFPFRSELGIRLTQVSATDCVLRAAPGHV